MFGVPGGQGALGASALQGDQHATVSSRFMNFGAARAVSRISQLEHSVGWAYSASSLVANPGHSGGHGVAASYTS